MKTKHVSLDVYLNSHNYSVLKIYYTWDSVWNFVCVHVYTLSVNAIYTSRWTATVNCGKNIQTLYIDLASNITL